MLLPARDLSLPMRAQVLCRFLAGLLPAVQALPEVQDFLQFARHALVVGVIQDMRLRVSIVRLHARWMQR